MCRMSIVARGELIVHRMLVASVTDFCNKAQGNCHYATGPVGCSFGT